ACPLARPKERWRPIGAIQGLLASYGAEISMHAGAVSDQHQRALDLTFTVLSIIPTPSIGIDVADYLIGVAGGQAQGAIEGLDDSILTDDDISRLSTHPRDVGKERLMTSIDGAISLSPEQRASLANTAAETVGSQYDAIANASANEDSTGEYNIFRPGENELHNTGSTARRDMP
ncbi:hypothetical protein JS562_53110, partial [Agrobacterium sp. S2]|nr:hypothetical protein [Agrobacterium sp. S2]